MIPLRLSLHNFMCYRNPDPLDFRGLHLACLAGNNGHGKSALLDAITWALWGRARSNQADELMHLGESEMWVDFEFALGPNRYRAVRSRERRGRSGKSDLQLQVWAPEAGDGGEFRPITEPTIRDTEARIVDLLRMDYDTFINSAFLVQGRADEFTVKPPNQRKQILADILGLNVYDDYEARAKERAREKRDGATAVEAQIAAIDEELGREDDYRRELEETQGQLLALGEQLRSAEHEQRALHGRRQDLLAQQRALHDLDARLQRAQQELTEAEAQCQSDEARLAADQNLLAQQAAVEDGYRTLLALRQADQEMNGKLARQAELQARRGRLEQQVGQARNRLETEQRLAAQEVQRLQALADGATDLEAQLAQARAELAELARVEARQAELRTELQVLTEEHARLKSENARLKDDMEDIKEKLDLLAEAGADCPICHQPLGEEERRRVLDDYRGEGKAMGDRHRANQARLAEVNQAGKQAEAALAETEVTLRARSRWQRQEATVESQLGVAEQAASDLEPARARLDEITATLAVGAFAEELQTALAGVDGQLAELSYDADAHGQVRDRLLQFEPYQDRHTQLSAALERRQTLQAGIERLRSQQERWREALAVDQARRAELATAVTDLPQVETDLRVQTAEVERLADLVNQARQRFGAAQQRLDACRAQAERRQELGVHLERLRDEQALYEELQAAFGKRGLQAMIIEAAIPEIEAEANRLLGRMTDGRMAVRMETQRETKTTQALRETLDIILSDELGSRDYSLFSGGEAFRANFAIRIALSKLLARRAGAQLRTLIVDEGFGTQDAQGRERLVQAITSIQDDFELILVITHIDELKDHFPARIDVVKTAEGSQISVS